MAVRVWEVLRRNQNARDAYLRVRSRPTGQEFAKNAICFLFWLEMAMGIEVLSDLVDMAPVDTTLMMLVKEAEALYNYLVHGHHEVPQLVEGIPTIAALCGGGPLVDFRFFEFHRELLARGVTVVRDTLAALVFDDSLHEMLRRFPDPVRSRELMTPFVACRKIPHEDSRKVFVAFAGGRHPPSSEAIKSYFERHYMLRRSIERIELEEPRAGQTAKHGVIEFKSRMLRNQAIYRADPGFHKVDGQDVWVQRYLPRR